VGPTQDLIASFETTSFRYSLGKWLYRAVVLRSVWPTHFLISSPGTPFCTRTEILP